MQCEYLLFCGVRIIIRGGSVLMVFVGSSLPGIYISKEEYFFTETENDGSTLYEITSLQRSKYKPTIKYGSRVIALIYHFPCVYRKSAILNAMYKPVLQRIGVLYLLNLSYNIRT